MSQRNETTVFILALLITLGFIGGGLWWFTISSRGKLQSLLNLENTQEASDRISFGEKILALGEVSPLEQEGVKAIADRHYKKAIASLEAALKLKRNDPSVLIFLNNARIGTGKSYTIAASLPISTDPNTSLEILRGIAQAQNEINQSGGIRGIPLKVGIANDEDNPEIAKQIAKTLVDNQKVLGVVGPTTSDATLAAGTEYTNGQLVAISPTSTSVKISNFSRYVFRTVPSDFIAARALADFMVKKLQKKNIAVFFNSQSNYSQSLKSEFVASVSLEGGQLSSEFDLSKSDFSAAKSVEQATKQGAEALMLAANTDTLDKALQVVEINQKRLAVLGGDDVYTPKTLEVGREQAVGMVVAVPWHIDGNKSLDFPYKSRQLWGADVNWRTAMAYDATRVLFAAIERNPTRFGVQQVIVSPNFSIKGASGTIRFLPSGDRNAQVQLVQIIRKNSSRSGTGYDFVPVSQ